MMEKRQLRQIKRQRFNLAVVLKNECRKKGRKNEGPEYMKFEKYNTVGSGE